METLVLGKNDVAKLLAMPEVIVAVETALKNDFSMPPKIYLDVPNGDYRAMPCHQGKFASIKWVSVYPNNPVQGLPTVMATLILNDASNAVPLAVMEAGQITAFRTGAMAGIATKYLARPNSAVLALVGAGIQARTQLLAIQEVLPQLREVRVTDAKPELAEKFAAEMQAKCKAKIIIAKSVEETVRGADVISTVTTSRAPVVQSEWVADGAHINAVGADAVGKEELDPIILKRAKVVVDNMEQASHSGEINVPISKGLFKESDVAAQMVDVVRNGKKVRESEKDVTVFCSTGLALQDLATASMVFEKAKKAGLGVKTEFV